MVAYSEKDSKDSQAGMIPGGNMMTKAAFDEARLMHAYECFQLLDKGLYVIEGLLTTPEVSRRAIEEVAKGIRRQIEELRNRPLGVPRG